MNSIHVLVVAVIVAGTGCAAHDSRRQVEVPEVTTGATSVDGSVAIAAGTGKLAVRMDALGDSVRWVLRSNPPGCARATTSPGRLDVVRHDRRCTSKLDISMPVVADVRLSAAVGDIEVHAPLDRAVRLQSRVGSVSLRIDGRELRRSGRAGSGDHLDVGDPDSVPRLVVSTGVGSVRVGLTTPSRSGTH
jgi:hypothetical protein